MKIFKEYSPPPVSYSEILRYLGSGKGEELEEKIRELLLEACPVLNFQVCYCKLNFTIFGDVCDFGAFSVKSRSLAEVLNPCSSAVVFLASVGHGIDRLIMKYSKISSVSALLLHAIGNERVEALCDKFCADMKSENEGGITRRFSPGYGDLLLELQKDIFKLLNPEKSMAVYLGDGLLMSPTKSVTAFFGIK